MCTYLAFNWVGKFVLFYQFEFLYLINKQLIIYLFFSETWRKFPDFKNVKNLLQKVKDYFTKSPARKNRYLNHLRFNGILTPRKVPLPVQTRWNTWFEMVFYTNDHIMYWKNFFNEELSLNPGHETLIEITSLLNSQYHHGIINIYIYFITNFAKQFVDDLDFFQTQNKPLSPYVEFRLSNLTAYINNNRSSDFFGRGLEEMITSLGFNPDDFYPIFRN